MENKQDDENKGDVSDLNNQVFMRHDEVYIDGTLVEETDTTSASLETEDETGNRYTFSGNTLRSDAILYHEPSYVTPNIPSYVRPISQEFEDQQPNEFFEKSYDTQTTRKTLSRNASTYELEKFKKNALIIFNHENLYNDRRIGTQVDVESLTKTFEKFGFEVDTHNDLRKKELMSELQKFTSRDFAEYGCIGVVVLTHGFVNGLLQAHDRSYSELEIIDLLKNKSLVTIPKLVIIQACRGSNLEPTVPVEPIIYTDTNLSLERYQLPRNSDILILHSCCEGTPAFRDELNGTVFIQTLCKKIEQRAHKDDMLTIFTEVSREVATNLNQMPELKSTLIRKLYLVQTGETLHPRSSSSLSTCKQTQLAQQDSWQSLLPMYFLYYSQYIYDILLRPFRRL